MSLFKCICCGTINTLDKISLKCGCVADSVIMSAPNTAIIEHSIDEPCSTSAVSSPIPIRGKNNRMGDSGGNGANGGNGSSGSSSDGRAGSLVSSIIGSCGSLTSYFRAASPPKLTLLLDGIIRSAESTDFVPGLAAVCCRCTYVPRVHWKESHSCAERFYRYHQYTSEYLIWRSRLWEICGQEYLREQHTAEYSIYTYYRGPQGQVDTEFDNYITRTGELRDDYLITQRFAAFRGRRCKCCDQG